MASLTPSLLFPPPPSPSPSSYSNSYSLPTRHKSILRNLPRLTRRRALRVLVMAANNEAPSSPQKLTKLVTFLGKGGSGKTTSSIFAAQHYAMAGLKTCLVIQSQDPTADYLLNCKIGTSPITCNNNLSAVRLETTEMLLEPLNRLKQADARLNMTQGVLEGVVGEELGVLPGMDSIFSALALQRLVGFSRNVAQRNRQEDKFDVIVYDGISTEETIRMIGATSKARLYLKYLRNLAEKTDLGRLAGPSLLRFADEAISSSTRGSQLNGKMSAEIWDDLEQTLEKGSSVFAEPSRFGCYLVMDPNSPASVNSALRFWGCTIQAGAQVSGAFGIVSPSSRVESMETVEKNFSPLPYSLIPTISMEPSRNWNEILLNEISKDAQELLSVQTSHYIPIVPSVRFDPAKKSVTLFMPGFDKSEIKLYQFRGGSELLVEAGDQRRVIHLPSQIQGKVGGAKFTDRSLIITMR
ncbi:uncharacterized protein At1g26090, chloroplastic isoform X1 [Camellia sinensis]|uniref:uncharacterized protein At1g26090, chloroplastic isoform X1 n=1 Tax=Camellia sinensis TaxID=4442 RepID=UPI0010357739|nr:uncharacterized protein At1g26090, chloroplastic isoform X1 [Camellia sinensis]